ncbi:MAG: tRNA (N(6)-L-threonylcarbamoyladenosine(37)-C(2))-methylthiotransferase MtaB [Clostridiales bacterium]|jgi:threonylcarbamoyladenosine tRNA methylthiotransferase MtaB|nr:tRNA (N(6)-L-threonylcarbamoyladenosine(37)-C(2))-methylthiotransferase MtaB [Clostridiales bacterium]
MTISLINLGCKVNQYELQSIKSALTARGHTVSEDLTYADAYILNTCAVTGEAERKSRQYVTKALKSNPAAKIVVIGCAAENNAENFEKKGAHYISGSAKKSKIADVVEALYKGNGAVDFAKSAALSAKYEEMDFASTDRARRFVKIQDGCDNFCSYCIIPILRGNSRSRDADGIIAEISAAAQKETVVIGINLSAYGFDTGTSLTELIIRLHEARPDLRLRLGSLEARVIDGDFLTALKALKNFCPHFHLSLQSGDDRVLADMNRRYDTQFFMQKTRLIREFFPNAAVTTDIIAGFPTESGEAFENTLKFAELAAFADIHIFPYSARQGTEAAKLKIMVADDVIKERVKRLTALKHSLRERYIDSFKGKILNVLIEEKNSDGLFSGYSENYIRIYAAGELKIGEIYKVKLTDAHQDGAKGEI